MTSSFMSGDLYAGTDLKQQLEYAERQIIQLTKETSELKSQRDWFEFKVEMLDKEILKLQEKLKGTRKDIVIDRGQESAMAHAENLLK